MFNAPPDQKRRCGTGRRFQCSRGKNPKMLRKIRVKVILSNSSSKQQVREGAEENDTAIKEEKASMVADEK